MTSQCHLLVLPPEILEHILVFCAGGSPQSIAAVAQTCSHLRALVYDPPDHHLWRALFLAAFDDPRHTVDYHEIEFNWQKEFTTRIWAGRYIFFHANEVSVLQTVQDDTSFSFAGESGQIPPEARAVQVLINMLKTALPSASYEQGDAPMSDELPVTPLLELHHETSLTPPLMPSQRASLTIEWLKHSLGKGMPLTTFTLLFFVRFQESLWRNVSGGQQLCEFTACIGYFPPRIVGNSSLESPPTGSRRSPRLRRNTEPSTSISAYSTSGISHPDAAKRAQKIAFNLRYLSPHRNWGPYIRHPPSSSTFVEEDGEAEEDDLDRDYVPPEDGESSHSATPEPQPPVPGPGGSLLPEQLYPDWVWLAAARIIAENTLYTKLVTGQWFKLEKWDNLREGAWISPRVPDLADEQSALDAKEERWKKHQWDWAGVEGVWRRLVCWLDYSSLIYWNSQDANIHEWDGDEAWIIVPMSLRITGYSAPSLATYPDRPTIHIKGEMGGAGWVGNIEVDEEDVRSVHGTVSMLPDGRVRWSITSTYENSEEDEWASEAIQLGGVGSAMGSLGMWTGAFHEEGDPLGVMWQWRVR